MEASRLRTTALRAAAVAAIAALLALSAPAGAESARWVSLFNGKNLDGWKIKITGHDLGENYGDTFRVENGVLKVSYDRYESFGGRFGHIFYEKPLSDYRLRVEYRFVGEQCPGGPEWGRLNSGVMLHSQSPESMRKEQQFPVSVEVQFLGAGSEGERTTANLCTPGTHVVMDGKLFTPHCVNSRSKTYRGDRWVTVEVEVRGGSTVKHIVDGEVVLEYSQPQLDESDADAKRLMAGGEKLLRGGYIALQAESHPLEIRRVEMLPLAASK